MATFSIGENNYSVRQMDPRVQFFVLKRLARFLPAIGGLGGVLSAMAAGESVPPGDAIEFIAVAAPLVAEAPDADLDFVSDACFDVTRQQGRDGDERWYPIRDPKSGVVSNQNNLAVMQRLAIISNVLRITFAPMLAEIAPNVMGLTGSDPDPETAGA